MALFRRGKFLQPGLVLAGLVGAVSPAICTEIDRGQALYENHCQVCHDDRAHTREGRKVNSLEALRATVTSWSVHANLGWTQQEIDDVIRYLNRQFYQLTE